VHQLEVVVEVLAEADPRVDRDPLGVDPGELGRLDPLPEILMHLADDVVVLRGLLHRRRIAPHVHQDDGGIATANDLEHRRIGAARHVVHDRGAGVQGLGSDARLPRVDRDRDRGVELGEPLDHRMDALQLLVHRDRGGAGAGGFAADVQHVRTVIDHPSRVRDGARPVEEPPAVGEGVGRDVEDPHDERALGAIERALADAPDGAAHGSIVAVTPVQPRRTCVSVPS
jgi:hypothetical protein